MQKRSVWSVLLPVGIVVAIFAVVFLVIVNSREEADKIDFGNYDPTTVIAPSVSNGWIGDHVRGNPDAPVMIFEYADFQCGGCATAQSSLKALVEEYDGKLAIVMRNFPVRGHQNAVAASSAAEAAGLQGLFFEMADMIYRNQAVWASAAASERTNLFVEYFQAAGGQDVEKFRRDMSSDEVKRKIEFDQALGNIQGVPYTPALFLNGELIDLRSATTTAEWMSILRVAIDRALAEAEDANNAD